MFKKKKQYVLKIVMYKNSAFKDGYYTGGTRYCVRNIRLPELDYKRTDKSIVFDCKRDAKKAGKNCKAYYDFIYSYKVERVN